MDKSSIVVWGVVAVFVALLGGWVADAMTPVASEDMKPGCHTDYYLWVVPVSAYCADDGNVTSENNPSETVWKLRTGSVLGSREPAERGEKAPHQRSALPKYALSDPSSYFPDSLSTHSGE